MHRNKSLKLATIKRVLNTRYVSIMTLTKRATKPVAVIANTIKTFIEGFKCDHTIIQNSCYLKLSGLL